MKSKEIKLTNSLSSAIAALEEVERTSFDAGLQREQSNLLRLLTEEMISMTTELLENCKGTLWLECEGEQCELHLTAVAPIEEEARAAFVEASKSKVNAPVKGLKNKISALVAGLLSSGDYPEFYSSMSAGFVGGYSDYTTPAQMPIWSLSAYEEASPVKTKEAEMDGVEKSILIGMADDVTVSVKSHWVEMVVTKKFAAAAHAEVPMIAELSRICVVVDKMEDGYAYYRRLLGATMDYFLPNWKNKNFCTAIGLSDADAENGVSIAFLRIPNTRLTLQLVAAPQLSSQKNAAHSIVLHVTNLDAAFLHVKAQPGVTLLGDGRTCQIGAVSAEDVRFTDRDVREMDERNRAIAKRIGQASCFYFIDKYGLQWGFEQRETR